MICVLCPRAPELTITIPAGSTSYGAESLLCVPPKWTDYVVFFAANYFAHAATLVGRPGRPGQPWGETVFTARLALCAPGSGVLRVIRGLTTRSAFANGNELRCAASAGALCTIINYENVLSDTREDWYDANSAARRRMARRTSWSSCLPRRRFDRRLQLCFPNRA